MKTKFGILSKLIRPAMIALAACAMLASTAKAATIEFWVNAYGNTWAILVPGSGTGGRVVYSEAYGWYITDRAQRGEAMEALFDSSTKAETRNPSISRCWLSSGSKSTNLKLQLPTMFSWTEFVVPTSPAWDNNYVNVQTVSGTFSLRIPVGGRP